MSINRFWAYLIIILFCFYSQIEGQHLLETIIKPVLDVEWSPDGRYLAVAQDGGGISIYNDSLNLLTSIYTQDSILSASWSPNSQQLVISRLGNLEILNWDENSLSLTFNKRLSTRSGFALWSPTSDKILVVNELSIFSSINDTTFETIAWVYYSISTWDAQTGDLIKLFPLNYRTRVIFRVLNETSSLGVFNPLIWGPDESEIILVGDAILSLSENFDDILYGPGGLIVLDAQTGEVKRQFNLETEPISIATELRNNFVIIAQEIGVFERDYLIDGHFTDSLSSMFDVAVLDVSRDGRYIFSDGQLTYSSGQLTYGIEEVGFFSNTDSDTLFTADWHPYRPIIAIGSLTGRLTIEDATQFEGFTASPVANSGENRVVYVGGDLTASVQLDASASVDYDGTITDYEWREGENVLSTDSIASVNLPMGIHDIQLTVTDNDNLTDIDTVQIEAICKTILTTESFADAITALQSQTEYDTVCLESEGEYTLTAPLPSITGNITLIGNGAKIVMTGEGRVFDVGQSGVLHLKDVTISAIQPETTPEPNPDGIMRGGINNAGELILEDVILENNSAVRGGAIYNAGVLTMKGGAIQNNSASEFGGGIYNAGQMDLDGVNIHENDAPEGSGVYQEG